jgi:hypothetical protein
MSASTAVSARKIEANRANASKSTGPRTPEGKARSSRNASVTHGFYSSRILLDGEDAGELEELRQELVRDLRPSGTAELLIVERLVTAHWKLRRLHECERRMLEHKLSNLRKYQKPADATPDAALAEMVYDGQELERLSLLERRLEGSIHRCHRELRLLRKDREQHQPEEISEASEVEQPREVENVRSEATAEGATEASRSFEHPATSSGTPSDALLYFGVSSNFEPDRSSCHARHDDDGKDSRQARQTSPR